MQGAKRTKAGHRGSCCGGEVASSIQILLGFTKNAGGLRHQWQRWSEKQHNMTTVMMEGDGTLLPNNCLLFLGRDIVRNTQKRKKREKKREKKALPGAPVAVFLEVPICRMRSEE